jgi:hypothetical protein
MSENSARDQLAAIVYRVNNPHYGDYGTHQETADAILAAGWRPPGGEEGEAEPRGFSEALERQFGELPFRVRGAAWRAAGAIARRYVESGYVPTVQEIHDLPAVLGHHVDDWQSLKDRARQEYHDPSELA